MELAKKSKKLLNDAINKEIYDETQQSTNQEFQINRRRNG